ncbi:hypothetical protein [Paenibacillus sp. JNUCC32]|uniref:hypothetical protein n=1 Tax=Paenibacillus sp. JNUCC32 TaxID=2777984 RepID=UPI001E527E9A|nr:hypothetical protein [Paenibacillus sp. JNUCC-32]
MLSSIEVACNAFSGALIIVLGAVSLYLWNSLGFFIGDLLFTQLRIKIPISNERKTVFSILLIIAGVVLLNLSGSAHAQEQPKTYESGH